MLRERFLLSLLMIWGCVPGCESDVAPKPESRSIVILKDLSLSTPSSEDHADNEFIGFLLASQLKAGDRIHVLGITESGFANSMFIMQGEIPHDDHPLHAEILRARERLLKDWNAMVPSVNLRARKTDIVGAICYSSLLLKKGGADKWLIVLSDMRQSAGVLNLERAASVDVEQEIARLRDAGSLPDLGGVQVAVLGMHTHGKHMDPGKYQSLEAFWRKFFVSARVRSVTIQADRNWRLP